ncbi:MAG: hypothetical protein KatS3mg024_0715 [Armatimonadota bacterium]|nr:MAG: hypothetical protein KatS3mg024_0715 [Armatimonadota bacterium]
MIEHGSLGVIATCDSQRVKVTPAPIGCVTMEGGFWRRWMDANRTLGIPALYRQLEDHGVVENFRVVGSRSKGDLKGPVFRDSDLYKWMEGAATALESSDDPQLRELLESVIDDVASAQQPDGYLNTFFVGELSGQRFRNLPVEHELYCAGHMFQAAIAHYRATGSRKFLDVAIRFADYLTSAFGPGKIEQPDGHPEVEMALVELYRITGKRDYLDLGGFFLKQQALGRAGQISGHAVRFAYLMAGVADWYAETGDRDAWRALQDLWEDTASGRVYITGGLGARYAGEAIGERYELPNEWAYSETCAAIANAMWNVRMLGLTGDARYADMMERALYNNVLAGVSLDTTHWFYVNPLACFREHQRQPWFGCTCCPTNMVRTLAAVPGYMYGRSKEGIWVHLYDASRLNWTLDGGTAVVLRQQTRYPWDGRVNLTVDPAEAATFSLFLRVPAWCQAYSAKVNGQSFEGKVRGGYLEIRRRWQPGDRVALEMRMPVQLMESDPRVRCNLGSVAVQRGPLVFCAESVDNPAVNLRDLELKGRPAIKAEFRGDLLEGVVTLRAKGRDVSPDASRGPLYRPLKSFESQWRDVDVTLIPYYAWANRGVSHMVVWMPYAR